MPNFTDVLSKPMSDIEKPKPYPVGTYLAMVQGQPEVKEIGNDTKYEVIDFTMTIMQPQADVDTEALAAANYRQGRRMRHRMFATEENLWRIKQFLGDHLGIDVGGGTLRQAMAEAPGRQCLVTLRHRPSQDGTQIYDEIASTAKA